MKFSVSMCVYEKDNPEWFRTAVDSILNQTVMPDEVVLVVDGPVADKLNEVIIEYEKSPLFKVIRLKSNQGLGNALRIATENASNDLIARMDSDDISEPTRFEQQIRFLEKNPTCDIVGGDISEFIDREDNIIAYRRVPTDDEGIKTYMKARCAFNHVTVMFRKSSVSFAGGYLDWYYNEDYYLWIRMQQNNAEFGNTGTVLVRVRIGEDMYNRRGGIQYFISEAKLQRYMLKEKMICIPQYVINISIRFFLQVLMTHRMRGILFRKFARSK